MLLNKFNYCALLKTTDAELKGFRELSPEAKGGVLPAFELTRSRRSKKNVDGSIYKRIEIIKEITAGRPFILDLTTHTDLQNQQIDDLFVARNGFKNWRTFLAEIAIPNLIPAIHVAEGVPEKDIVDQARILSSSFEKVAFRVDARDEDTMSYLSPILSALKDTKQLVVLIDTDFVQRNTYQQSLKNVSNRISEIGRAADVDGFACLSSSFPTSVAPYGDTSGEFSLYEVILSNEIINQISSKNIVHGDYGLVHPKRYEAMMAGWVPRIDIPLDDQCFYHRYRREDGGYVKAGKEVLKDDRYETLNTWSDSEIKIASKGIPNGRSPSHWIAARVNLHMTRQVIRTSE